MSILQAFRLGMQKVNQSKRMIALAWFGNVAVAAIVVLPVLGTLERTIGPTLMEERLLERIDPNWFQTFKEDHRENPLIRMFDYGMFGAGPFLEHYDSHLSGKVITGLGTFFTDLFFRFRVRIEDIDPIVFVAFLYTLLSTFFSSAFVGMFSKDYSLSFQEFLIEGSRYLGKFFRLALVAFVLYFLLFQLLFDCWAEAIPDWTAHSRSEVIPFVLYIVKNVVVALVLGFLTLCFDYAKIRIVLEDRTSALAAAWAGFTFVIRHPGKTIGLSLLLTLMGLAIIVLAVGILQSIHASGYWSIVLVFLLHQFYLFARQWVKAMFYSSQTQLARSYLQSGGFEIALNR